MADPLLLSSSVLRTVTVEDNNEKLVDLKETCPGIIFKIAEYIKTNGGEQAVLDARYVREEVAIRLAKAQSLLPNGFKLMIDNAYRSPDIQQKSYDKIYKRLKDEHPDWTREQYEQEMDNRVAPVDIAPHCTGGALDLSIINDQGEQLDMGTGLDEYSDKTFTASQFISDEAKKNRGLLVKVMTEAGFVNFPAEWWHWSYGDREWGYFKNNKIAVYGTVKI